MVEQHHNASQASDLNGPISFVDHVHLICMGASIVLVACFGLLGLGIALPLGISTYCIASPPWRLIYVIFAVGTVGVLLIKSSVLALAILGILCMLFATVLSFFNLVRAASSITRASAQEDWDRFADHRATTDRAAELERHIEAGDEFAVYLRGFWSERPRSQYWHTDVGAFVIGHTFHRRPQGEIAKLLPINLPVYTVVNLDSLDPSPLYNQVIVPGKDWEAYVVRHVRGARLIIVYYEHPAPGIDAECDLLTNDSELSRKCWLVYNNYTRKSDAFVRLEAVAKWKSAWTPDGIVSVPSFEDFRL